MSKISFAQNANLLRRGRRKKHTPHSRATNAASQKAEKGTEMWKSLYEAKILEYEIDEKLSVLTDVAESIKLNKRK